MKVFLGGTCSGYKWRDKLIQMLKKEDEIKKADLAEYHRIKEKYGL